MIGDVLDEIRVQDVLGVVARWVWPPEHRHQSTTQQAWKWT